mmetsp:Transcript_48594/g.138880  ORF Transcript_48594/g.138880 Transcript_48594/m.138880 type:complete len:200 (+) Transcript_48594:90-689(+)
MGSVVSSLEERQRSLFLDGKLADIKQAKKVRDMELSARIAATRDRLCWIGAYYGFVACVSVSRHVCLHRAGVRLHFDNFFLPLNVAFVCAPPFLFAYQLDLALPPRALAGLPLGGKANRIADEAARIREGSVHRWFGSPWLPLVDDGSLCIRRPLCLPLALEEAYRRERARTARERAARGLDRGGEWAHFEEACGGGAE